MKIVFIALCIALAVAIVCALVKKKRKSAIGKIYKTTDGFLSDNPKNRKKRNVVAVEQRKFDGAIAVCKVFGKDEKKTGDFYVDNLTLSPKDHPTLTKDSLVERRVTWGVKRNGKHEPIYRKNLVFTNDRLTKQEYKSFKKQIGGKTQKNRKTYRNTRRKWKNGFKSKRK